MRAIVCHRLAEDRSGLRFEPNWPDPLAPGPGQVTVAVAHAALNFPDVLMLSGGYQYAPPLPFIPGLEGTGWVIAIGQGVDPALICREVIVGARCGLFAERVTVSAEAVRPLPAGLDLRHGAAFTVAALTAQVALVSRGRVQAGERLAVAGAGGGTGLAAIALAKALGAVAIGLASSDAKLEAALAAGADEVRLVPRGSSDVGLVDLDAVFDPVGGALALPLLAALRSGGRYLVVGFTAGVPVVPFDRLAGGVEVVGVRAGELARRDPTAGAANLAAIDAMAARLVPRIGLHVGLNDAAEAFAAMATATLIGKAVIDFT